MHLLHFILFVLLGLLAPSTASKLGQGDSTMQTKRAPAELPGQVVDVATGDVGQDLFHTVDNNLAARQGFPSNLLLRWDVVCGTSNYTEEAPGEKPGSKIFLTSGHCRTWFACKSDGTWTRNTDHRTPKSFTKKYRNWEWCYHWCKCMLIDEPAKHPDYNFGCIKPEGGSIHGQFGSVSRDTDLLPDDDGLVLEAFEGPPRKD